jgi:serine/threonine protein kinase
MPLEEQVDVLAGRYRLGKVIGRGGMADVYRAEDELLEREVAVKVLRARTATERDRARFETEAKTVAQFDHPHLVTLLDAGIDHDTPYLVMDLVEGPSLAAACADGPLPPEQVGGIGAALCEALSYVHGHDVVHRDLKPGNVLLGGDGRVRLADFGIARLLGDTAGHTATGTLIGTAAYLAPEQVKGLPVSPASDVYSLGLLLLEALTGVRAYTGTPTEAALARLHNPPPIPDDVPDGWPDLIRAMTSLEPAARPAAKEAAVILQRLAQAAARHQPAPRVEPEPAVQPERRPVMPPAREDRRRAADSAPGTHSFPVPEAHDEHADRPRRRGRMLVVTLGVAAVLAAAVLGVMAATTTGHGGPATPIPSHTPADLRAPLSDLHQAVAG